MMTEPLTGCALGMSPDDLSAWRDGALDVATKARLDTHVPGCRACRARVGEYDDIAQALRAIPAPEPRYGFGRDPRGHGTNSAERHTPVHPAIRRQRTLGSLGAGAAVVLLALGFAQVLHYHATMTTTSQLQRTPTPLPTAVPAAPAVDGPHVNWQQAQLPLEPLTDRDNLSYAVVPGHGESAYACHTISDSTGTTLTFYRTTDRGLHWTTLTQFREPGVNVAVCMVQVDALDANLVLAQTLGQSLQTFKELTWYELSEDGGATWTQWQDSLTTYGLTTLNGKTYALRREGTTGPTQNLSVSVDHLHTWEPIDQALVRANQEVSNFWVSPDGELLAEVTSVTNAGTPTPTPTVDRALPRIRRYLDVMLWHSNDGGVHWTPFPAPTLSGTALSLHFTVGLPEAGQPWQICAPYHPQSSPSAASLACTFDGGRTWSARPFLCFAAPCPSGATDTGEYTLASDGAVLTMAMAPGTTNQLGLYRLPRGSTTWQYIGPTAGSNTYFFAPTTSGGILWAYAGGTYPGRLSGVIGGQQALPGVLATATYP